MSRRILCKASGAPLARESSSASISRPRSARSEKDSSTGIGTNHATPPRCVRLVFALGSLRQAARTTRSLSEPLDATLSVQ